MLSRLKSRFGAGYGAVFLGLSELALRIVLARSGLAVEVVCLGVGVRIHKPQPWNLQPETLNTLGVNIQVGILTKNTPYGPFVLLL